MPDLRVEDAAEAIPRPQCRVGAPDGPLEGRRLETPEAVCLYQANQLDARVAESL